MAKPDGKCVYYITEMGTETFVEMRRSEICAMSPAKGSSTYPKGTHVKEKEDTIVNEHNVLFYN
jgi:hypothetical protein